jgi:hypothetical protein
MPPNGHTQHCTGNVAGSKAGPGSVCYFYNSTGASLASHKASCVARGGHLVAFNNATEQRLVEAVFSISGHYWIGVEPGAGGQWALADGSGTIGTGRPSNTNPYAHWWGIGTGYACMSELTKLQWHIYCNFLQALTTKSAGGSPHADPACTGRS